MEMTELVDHAIDHRKVKWSGIYETATGAIIAVGNATTKEDNVLTNMLKSMKEDH